ATRHERRAGRLRRTHREGEQAGERILHLAERRERDLNQDLLALTGGGPTKLDGSAGYHAGRPCKPRSVAVAVAIADAAERLCPNRGQPLPPKSEPCERPQDRPRGKGQVGLPAGECASGGSGERGPDGRIGAGGLGGRRAGRAGGGRWRGAWSGSGRWGW